MASSRSLKIKCNLRLNLRVRAVAKVRAVKDLLPTVDARSMRDWIRLVARVMVEELSFEACGPTVQVAALMTTRLGQSSTINAQLLAPLYRWCGSYLNAPLRWMRTCQS